MEIKKEEKEASLGEFMKVSLEGFSWAENICQRVESLCAENNMVQNSGKYVNVVGEHFKKVIDTVVNDLCDHADDVLELFSELSFGHTSPAKTSGKKCEELDGLSLHENPSTCLCEETSFMEHLSLEHGTIPTVMENLKTGFKKDISDVTFFTSGKLHRTFPIEDSFSDHGDGAMVHERSVEIEENAYVEKYDCVRIATEVHSVEVLNQVQLPSEPQFLNIKDISADILVETPMFGDESLNCSTKNFSDAATLDVDLTTSLSLTEANSFMTHKSIQTDGPSPFNLIYILDIESTETSFILESDGSELASKIGPKEGENSMKYENLNSFSREGFGNSSIFSLKNEDMSEFEDVKLEDDFKAAKVENDWDDIVKTEIALISSLAAKKDSPKKKLKKLFTSRWRPSSKSRELATSRDDLQSKTSSDFDWELL